MLSVTLAALAATGQLDYEVAKSVSESLNNRTAPLEFDDIFKEIRTAMEEADGQPS